MRIRNILVVVAGLAAVVGVSLIAAHRNSGAVPVLVSRVAWKPFVVKLPENGVVMRPKTATVPALISGNVGKMYVRAGQFVSAGQLLATIDNPALVYSAAGSRAEYLSASANVELARVQARNARVGYQAQVDTSKSALDLAQRTYRADVTLYANQAIARQQLDQDKARLDQARIAYQQALEQLKLGAVTSYNGDSVQYAIAAARRARITDEQNQQQLSFTNVTAPFDGTIQTVAAESDDRLRSLQSGDAVTAGQALFTIAGSGGYIVKAEVDEQDVIDVRVGQRVEISGQDFPGKSISGRVAHIAPVAVKSSDASSTARQVLTTIRLASSPRFLKDGMTADVDILTTDVPRALVVPNAAVRKDGKSSYVYTIERGVARKQAITIGATGDTVTWVKSGLRAGEVVLADANASVTAGTRVRVLPSPSASPSAAP